MGIPSNAQVIWDDLIAAGASPLQAAGIEGNIAQESGGNPESQVPDPTGTDPSAWSHGLVMWNDAGAGAGISGGANGKNAGSWGQYITGNPTADIGAQIDYLVQHGALADATGTTPQDVALHFEQAFERAAPQYANLPNREDSAAMVANAAATGVWPTTTSAAGTATGVWPATTSATGTAQTTGILSNAVGSIWSPPSGLITRALLVIVGLALLIVGVNALTKTNQGPTDILLQAPSTVADTTRKAYRKGGTSPGASAIKKRLNGASAPSKSPESAPGAPYGKPKSAAADAGADVGGAAEDAAALA